MAGMKPYPQELRERAVRMVAQVRPNYESDWAAITAVAAPLGIGKAETLRKWVRQAQVDDGQLTELVRGIHAANYGVYKARKIWHELHRQGHSVARCTVERLMRDCGLTGVVRGKKIRTTMADPGHDRAVDLLNRDFTARRPNRCWVADFTHVMTWSGVVYIAFVVDVYSRAIVGWSAATNKRTRWS